MLYCVSKRLLPLILPIMLASCGGAENVESGACVQFSMVGIWEGRVEAPSEPVYAARLEFRADCRYSVSSINLPDVGYHEPTLYYGINTDSPNKTYGITKVLPDGTAEGEMVIVFDAGVTQTGRLLNIIVSDTQLSFELWNDWEAGGPFGPVRFELVRK